MNSSVITEKTYQLCYPGQQNSKNSFNCESNYFQNKRKAYNFLENKLNQYDNNKENVMYSLKRKKMRFKHQLTSLLQNQSINKAILLNENATNYESKFSAKDKNMLGKYTNLLMKFDENVKLNTNTNFIGTEFNPNTYIKNYDYSDSSEDASDSKTFFENARKNAKEKKERFFTIENLCFSTFEYDFSPDAETYSFLIYLPSDYSFEFIYPILVAMRYRYIFCRTHDVEEFLDIYKFVDRRVFKVEQITRTQIDVTKNKTSPKYKFGECVQITVKGNTEFDIIDCLGELENSLPYLFSRVIFNKQLNNDKSIRWPSKRNWLTFITSSDYFTPPLLRLVYKPPIDKNDPIYKMYCDCISYNPKIKKKYKNIAEDSSNQLQFIQNTFYDKKETLEDLYSELRDSNEADVKNPFLPPSMRKTEDNTPSNHKMQSGPNFISARQMSVPESEEHTVLSSKIHPPGPNLFSTQHTTGHDESEDHTVLSSKMMSCPKLNDANTLLSGSSIATAIMDVDEKNDNNSRSDNLLNHYQKHFCKKIKLLLTLASSELFRFCPETGCYQSNRLKQLQKQYDVIFGSASFHRHPNDTFVQVIHIKLFYDSLSSLQYVCRAIGEFCNDKSPI